LKSIYLGYDDNELGYRLRDPLKRRVNRCRNVIFNEEKMFKTIDKGVEVQKFVEIQKQLENQPPLEEDTTGNNEYSLQQNETEVQEEEEHEEQKNQQPLGENPPPNLSIRGSTSPHRPSQRYPPSEYILLTDEGEPACF